MKHSTPAAVLLGERVRELRVKRKLTQQGLADAVRIPQTHVSAIERGVMLPSLLTVIRLAIALDCKVITLVSTFDKEDLPSLVPK